MHRLWHQGEGYSLGYRKGGKIGNPSELFFLDPEARLIAATLARRFGPRIRVVEPYASELPREFNGTKAALIDIDTALEESEILIVLVDHDAFKAVPLAERSGKLVYDTRGIWLDQPKAVAPAAPGLRLAS